MTSPGDIAVLSSSCDSSIRGSPEYIHAFELEAWKREQETRFLSSLRQKEKETKQAWDIEFAERENEREIEFKAKMKQLGLIEQKLRAKLAELESREHRLQSADEDLKRDRRETDVKIRHLNEEHALSLRSLEETHACSLRVESERLRIESMRRIEAERELERRGKTREAYPSEVAELHAKLKIKEFELAQALDREGVLIQSREHFRTALVAVMQGGQAVESVGVSMISMVPEDQPISVIEGFSPGREQRILRLKRQREGLVSAGYAESDRVIKAIDLQIEKAEKLTPY